MSLRFPLQGGLDRAAEHLAAGFGSTRTGRLVVLGEPRAGKTVLAIMMTLGLLARRQRGAPAPILLPKKHLQAREMVTILFGELDPSPGTILASPPQ